MERTFSRCFALLLAVVNLAGCGGEDSTNRSARRVVLFAAASTIDALDEITEQFEQQSGTEVQASYAASSTLAQQIAAGAGADVFVSANTQWADYLDEHEMVEKRQDLLQNRLVIIVPDVLSKELNLRKPRDLLNKEIERLALADTAAVPAGLYAKEALSKLGLWEQLKEKVVAGADVRQTLTHVEIGAAEAGIVYATDAASTNSVKVAVEIPADLTGPIYYPIVLLKRGSERAAAESFYRYLCSPDAAKVFRKHGFVVRAVSVDSEE